MSAVWIVSAEPHVTRAAREQGRRIGLPDDGHRDADAYSHAQKQAAVRGTDSFDTECACRAWMIAVARNWVRDQGRRAGARRRHEANYARPAAAPDRAELLEEVRAAVATLNAEHRDVLDQWFAHRTVDEIAARLGRTRAQVYPLLQRARAALRAALERREVTAADLTERTG
ncbi:MAG: sigma-70 family RNA polymerase sigma factor [Planctomycetes bacterium]|nr:sigma-70 family RNA polymerase sigma factor [Planctomycetota bacterium]